jgi:Tfp pilus assembly protein PilO
MRGQHADKIWMAGGAIAAALLTLLTWLLLVGPKNDATETTRLAASENVAKAAAQQETVKRLEQDNANLPTYQAELAGILRAVPQSDEFPDLLRTLRETAEENGVEVTSLSVAGAAKIDGSSPVIFDMPLSMGVKGDSDDVQRFLNDLQQHRDRAVLIDSVSVSGASGSVEGEVTLSLALHVFVSGDAPVTAGGQPAVG